MSKMKKYISYIAGVAFLFSLMACSSGFNQKQADELMEKENLTAEDYSALLDLYNEGMDDAIEFSKKEPDKLSEADRQEVLTVFAIGMRLNREQSNLSPSQQEELESLNQKGTNELGK